MLNRKEQKGIEKLYGHRKNTKDFLPGGSEELKKKANESFEKRKKEIRHFLDDQEWYTKRLVQNTWTWN